MDENINGLEPEEIEQELHILVDTKVNLCDWGDDVTDPLFDALSRMIQGIAHSLTMVETLDAAEQSVWDALYGAVEEVLGTIGKKVDPKEIDKFVSSIAVEIPGLMQDLGFSTENVSEV